MNFLHSERSDFCPVYLIITHIEDSCTRIHITIMLSLYQTKLSKCICLFGINNQLMR